MGSFLKNIKQYSLIAIVLLCSCNQNSFVEFPNEDSSFQIFIKGDKLLRAINTDNQGARKLQLYTLNGKLIDEVIMHNEPFNIENWENDSIEVKFYTSNVDIFNYWLKENEHKPIKLSNYGIKYTYHKITQGYTPIKKSIDSLYISSGYHVYLLNKDSVLGNYPINQLSIYPDKLSFFENKEEAINYIKFVPQNESLIHNFLETVIKK